MISTRGARAVVAFACYCMCLYYSDFVVTRFQGWASSCEGFVNLISRYDSSVHILSAKKDNNKQ